MSTSDLICRVSTWGGDVVMVSLIGSNSVSPWLARMGYRVRQRWWAVLGVMVMVDSCTQGLVARTREDRGQGAG